MIEFSCYMERGFLQKLKSFNFKITWVCIMLLIATNLVLILQHDIETILPQAVQCCHRPIPCCSVSWVN